MDLPPQNQTPPSVVISPPSPSGQKPKSPLGIIVPFVVAILLLVAGFFIVRAILNLIKTRSYYSHLLGPLGTRICCQASH